MNAIRTHSVALGWFPRGAGCNASLSAQRGGTRPPSMINGILCSQYRLRTYSLASCAGIVQCLPQIFENIVDVLDSNTQTNHLWRDSNLRLLLVG